MNRKPPITSITPIAPVATPSFERPWFFSAWLCAALLLATTGTPAQTPTQKSPQALTASTASTGPSIEGKTLEGNPFRLASLKGKVVLVMFWSTGCAVCRDKMPELRNNYAGWAGKPFEMVVVNTDARVQDFLDYERIISTTVPVKQRFVQLWTGETGYKDNIGKLAQLPTAFLIDKNGKVVERYVGRIPAEAWDKIADLL
jgi:thiol-disulfide isomerase/thioredoxin